ncbi:MAG: hypothetical protein K1X89_23915 [Myxococcaceae bacterium]|nr:hypothetical protein [Myxococcaceae bacterium]
MMQALMLAVLLSAGEAPVLSLAAPELTVVGLPAEQATYFTENLAQQLTLRGARTITTKEMSALIGLERQKQLLGCSAQGSSCIAELAGALGTDGVVIGDVGKLGSVMQVNLRVVSAEGKLLAIFSKEAANDDALREVFQAAAASLVRQTAKALSRVVPEAAVEAQVVTGSPVRRYFWVPAVVGAVVTGVGVGLLVDAGDKANQLKIDRFTGAQASDLRTGGQRNQTLGAAGIGIGVAAIAAGAAMYLFGDSGAPAVAVVPGPSGAMVSVSGVLP